MASCSPSARARSLGASAHTELEGIGADAIALSEPSARAEACASLSQALARASSSTTTRQRAQLLTKRPIQALAGGGSDVAQSAELPYGDYELKLEVIGAGDAYALAEPCAGALAILLEDEHAPVRAAAVEAVCTLGALDPALAQRCAELLVDSLADDVPRVRARALACLRRLGAREHLCLGDEHARALLDALCDRSIELRALAARVFETAQLETDTCAREVLEALAAVSEECDTRSAASALRARHPSVARALPPSELAARAALRVLSPVPLRARAGWPLRVHVRVCLAGESAGARLPAGCAVRATGGGAGPWLFPLRPDAAGVQLEQLDEGAEADAPGGAELSARVVLELTASAQLVGAPLTLQLGICAPAEEWTALGAPVTVPTMTAEPGPEAAQAAQARVGTHVPTRLR